MTWLAHHQSSDMRTIPLPNFRIPDYLNSAIIIDGSPLAIIDAKSYFSTSENPISSLALCTVLYNWCPDALAAFLDLDAWFSFTWIRKDGIAGTTIEIGRVGNQITFGTLDVSGDEWKLMITYNIGVEGDQRGKWIVNAKECMKDEEDVTDVGEIERSAGETTKTWIESRIWDTGKKVAHEFYVEYAPMDVWGDGIRMNPHWLYRSLDLTSCSTCGLASSASMAPLLQLSRCGKCGIATYCSPECQTKDWPVHKHICSLGLEERGQMLAITQKGGLIEWDSSRMFAREGSGESSRNPYFGEGTEKRWRGEEWFGEGEEHGEEDQDITIDSR